MSGYYDDDGYWCDEDRDDLLAGLARMIDRHDHDARAEALAILGDIPGAPQLRLLVSLLEEIISLLRDGLFDEAGRRLQCWMEPKFFSVADCEAQYKLAMQE